MPKLARLSYFTEYHKLHLGNVYQQLALTPEFREAIGARKIQGFWFVDTELVESFNPAEWNVYGERRIVIDENRFIKVGSIDALDERTRKIRYLLSKSQAVKIALGARTFGKSRALYIEAETFREFDPDEWLYCHDRRDWTRDFELNMAPLVRAVKPLPDKAEVLRKFRLNPLVREVLGAKKYKGDSKWWIDKILLSQFDARFWPYEGEKLEHMIEAEPVGPTPRSFNKRVVNEKKAGMLTMREASWIVGLDKGRLRKRLYDSEFADQVGANKSESGFWFFDESKLRTHFQLEDK